MNALKPLLDALDARLTDARLAPAAPQIKWRKDYLKLLLKEKYRHVAPLGCRAFRENVNSIQNLDLGIKIILSLGSNLVIMCDCAEPPNCHRFTIAQELRRRGLTVEELESWQIDQNF